MTQEELAKRLFSRISMIRVPPPIDDFQGSDRIAFVEFGHPLVRWRVSFLEDDLELDWEDFRKFRGEQAAYEFAHHLLWMGKVLEALEKDIPYEQKEGIL